MCSGISSTIWQVGLRTYAFWLALDGRGYNGMKQVSPDLRSQVQDDKWKPGIWSLGRCGLRRIQGPGPWSFFLLLTSWLYCSTRSLMVPFSWQLSGMSEKSTWHYYAPYMLPPPPLLPHLLLSLYLSSLLLSLLLFLNCRFVILIISTLEMLKTLRI